MAIGSIFSANPLNQAQAAQQTQLQRLSSGLRINSAKDDAAGLAIAVRLTSQLGGTAQASRNVSDGISLVDTASGALSNVSDSLQRINELAIQANNSTNSASDLQAIQTEINQLSQNINDVNNNASFNGQQLFSGTFTANIQSGPNAGDTTSLAISATGTTALGISGIDVTTSAGATAAITSVATALDSVTSQQASLGATSAGLSSTQANLNNSYENIAASRSRIQDNDFAKSSTDLATSSAQSFAAIAALNAYKASHKDNLRLISTA
ncbi:MAG: flagellin [Methylophilaceae bacterium]